MTSPAEVPQPSLQQQLDEITAQTRALVPAARLEPIEGFIRDLGAQQVERHVLAAGSPVPHFRLRSATEKPVDSVDLLALGPLVIKFFRGRWDPYDMTELETWQQISGTLRNRRALLVGISPQLPRQNAFTADRHRLTFPLLSDPGCHIAEQFGLVYSVPAAMQTYYRSILVNVPLLNGDSSWRLPVPAAFVVSATGEIVFSQGYADHRMRPDPAEVLAAVPSSME